MLEVPIRQLPSAAASRWTSTSLSLQADFTTGGAEIAALSGELANANSNTADALASAAQATAEVQLLTAACDGLHNDVSALAAERVRRSTAVPACLPVK